MLKKLLCISFILLFCGGVNAEFKGYLKVSLPQIDVVMARLDEIIKGQPGTTHYSLPQYSVNPQGLDYVIFLLDERAEKVLTKEEWDSRLTEMPIEFKGDQKP